MDNLEQAAILLLGLGEQNAALVLKQLNHKEVEKIVEKMRTLENISEEKVIMALTNFLNESSTNTGLDLGTNNFIRNSLISAVGEKRASSLLDKALADEPVKGLDSINWHPAKSLFEIIENEHPQVVAIIFTYLDHDKSAELLAKFSPDLRVDILRRLTDIGPISPLALNELAAILDKQLSEDSSFRQLPIGGVKKAADIVNFMGNKLETDIIERLSKLDEQLSVKLQEFMFPFERLSDVEKRSMQTLIRNIPNETLTMALKGADEKMRSIFFTNMSERAADMLKDDLDSMGPTPIAKVFEAQKEIVAIAQRLAKEGEIMLGGGDDLVK